MKLRVSLSLLFALICAPLAVPTPAHAAIAFATSTIQGVNCATTCSFTYDTTSVSNPETFICVGNNSTTDNITGATFNGANATLLKKREAGDNSLYPWLYLFAIAGQAGSKGFHDVVFQETDYNRKLCDCVGGTDDNVLGRQSVYELVWCRSH